MVQPSAGDAGNVAAGGQGRRRFSGGVIALLTGLGLLVIFMIQNRERVQLQFLLWSFTWPVWLFALVMALVGAIVWLGLGVLRRHRRRVARREGRRD